MNVSHPTGCPCTFCTVTALSATTDSPEDIAALLRALRSPSSIVRSFATRRLGEVGPATQEVIQALERCLEKKDQKQRTSALQALVTLGHRSQQVVPSLIGALHSDEYGVAEGAADGLGELGYREPEITRALWAVAQAQNPFALMESILWRYAIWSLARLKFESPAFVDHLQHHVRSHNRSVRALAASALTCLGYDDPDIIETIIDGRSGLAWVWGQIAVIALAKIACTSDRGNRFLLDRLITGDKTQHLAQDVVTRLGKTEHATVLGTRFLDGLLGAASEQTRRAAAMALVQVGHASSRAVEVLIESVRTGRRSPHYSVPDIYTRREAAQSLGGLPEPSPAVAAVLVEVLGFRDYGAWPFRETAAISLGKLKAGDPEVIVGLCAATRDTSIAVRVAAVKALGEIGASDEPVVIAIRRRLADRHPRVRAAAADTLGHLPN
jgi:HEAT repeat protein